MFPSSHLGEVLRQRIHAYARKGAKLPQALSALAPLDLRIVGRVVLQSVLVGVAAGLMGALFFLLLEYTQTLVLERGVGYVALRAQGELTGFALKPGTFRPWLLVLVPAIGGLLCGLCVRFAREARGGGGNATIDAFHHHGGIIRRRVIWVKMVASLCSLGTGGAGGREGPTMLIGGALGSFVGRLLNVNSRERRILLVAGVAAGISAVFRTPLGAALLAVEFLYKDGFESDALIPAVLASVVSYSLVFSLYGQSTLFGHVPRVPLVLAHLPLYALLALLVSAVGALFVKALHVSHRCFAALPIPSWLRPALGGLLLGAFTTPIVVIVGRQVQADGQGLGLLGGGYGAVQAAISGAEWLPHGWFGVELLVMLAFAKVLASALTIGSDGSAGDFAPSLAIGGLLGGAFGRAAQLLSDDPRLSPAAFALVGMGALYGGVANVPLSALILVCELAGNYDLLVPLMLALGISYVALRRANLYDAQVPTQGESPAHRQALLLEAFRSALVREVVPFSRAYASFSANATASVMLDKLAEVDWQDVFPVLDANGHALGLVTAESLRVVAAESEGMDWVVALDLMQPVVSVSLDDDLRVATERLLANSLRAIPVINETGKVVGLLDETDITQWHLSGAPETTKSVLPPSRPSWEIPLRK
jgi:CIC family chloride channel protein